MSSSPGKMAEKQLIEAVGQQKFLYDTSHSDYIKSKLKNEKWNDIAREINLNNGKYFFTYTRLGPTSQCVN